MEFSFCLYNRETSTLGLILPRSHFSSNAMHWQHLIYFLSTSLFSASRSVQVDFFFHKTKFPMMIVAVNFQYTHYICTICSLSIHPLLVYMLLVLLLLLFVSSFWSSFSLDTHSYYKNTNTMHYTAYCDAFGSYVWWFVFL